MSKRIVSSTELPAAAAAGQKPPPAFAAIRDRSGSSSGKLRVDAPRVRKARFITKFETHPFRKPERALAAVECRQHPNLPSSGLTSNQSNLI
ncbi:MULTISPECIES: hypothetical protein [Rhizobium]|uniref:hypothetical protein n=1 Tax=Rhizobium TaxID=379 RepID=UPI001106862B|nr:MULTISPECIES: hypothetical protein [Rhizobium]MBX4896892.1 hypothetical protein [Rhizobium bangladeshense]MBY3614066.1 hypothetical protein [Rhizobium bangladeshense]TLX10968.1 hypothetical protein FFR93_20925 [Rhizobium sp. MHM7A]